MSQNSFLKIVFLFIFSTNNFVAQNKSVDLKAIWENVKNADSTRFNALNEFYIKNTYSQPDYVIKLTDFHFELAKNKNNKIEMVTALEEKSIAYSYKSNAKNAIESIKKAIQIQTTLNDKVKLATLYSILGNIYNMQNKYVETLRYNNYALQIFKSSGEELRKATVLVNIGITYLNLKNYDLALFYFESGLLVFKKQKKIINIASINFRIALVYFEKKKYKKAIELTENSLKTFQVNNDVIGSSICYALLAKIYQKTNKKDNSFINIKKSLALNQKLGNTVLVMENKIFLAELYLETDIIKATQIAEEALAMLGSDSTINSKANLYNLLYKCYKKTNKIDLSHQMYEKYVVYNDSVVIEQSNLELIKEAVNQEYKIALSKTKQSFQKSEKELKRGQLIKLVLVILISLLLVFIIYFFARKKSIANRKEREALVEEIEKLKKSGAIITADASEIFELNRTNIETSVNRKLNETDWSVLNVLLQNPVSSNKEIASQIFLSIDGIGSSLRRMYEYFEIGESKYKKTDLIRKAIQFSNNS